MVLIEGDKRHSMSSPSEVHQTLELKEFLSGIFALAVCHDMVT